MSDNRFFNLGLPQLPTNTDPKVEPDLRDVFNSLRNLSYLIGQYGGFEEAAEGRKNPENVTYTAGPYKRRIYCVATEAITYGAIVNLHDVAGVTNVRHANATDATRPTHGINNTPGTCAIGDTIEIVLPGCYVTSIGGLTIGQQYFMSTVDGIITTAAPAAAGNVRQGVGFALTADTFFFLPDSGWFVI
jgi:hypothetical protein